MKARFAPIGQGVTAVTIKNVPQLHDGAGSSMPLIIPTLTIQQPSPTHRNPPTILFLGSPPPQRASITPEDNFALTRQQRRGLLKDFDKPTSLDLPCVPPTITITCNLSEAESDTDGQSGAKGTTSNNMCYLSPFSMCSRNDRTTSESNLSSSGYSSMASPGPSRCGSNNPLCPSENEDPGSSPRRPLSLLKTEPEQLNQANRGRSDSETLSDDQLLESNDEGIGTDHIDDKIEDGELKSAKELEVFMDTDDKSTLKLPAIYVQDDIVRLSPVSSRSESPLSDKTLGRYNRKDIAYTDSDGLYDLTSSDLNSKLNLSVAGHRKSVGRRRDKKPIKCLKTPSPTKHNSLLDIPGKDPLRVKVPLRKLSPKRRIRSQQRISSSSSSESLHSAKEMKVSSSSPSPDTIRWPGEWDKKAREDTMEVSAVEAKDLK